MTQWMENYADASGVRLHYWRTGGDKPVVVLAHGITDSGLCWSRVAHALEDDYDLVMYDTRLHGLSDKPDEPYGWDVLADDAAAFIQALDLDKPAMLGHSLGAHTTATVASKYPGLLGRALLSDPVFRDPIDEEKQSDDHNQDGTESVRAYKAMGKEGLLEMVRERSPMWHEDELEPWAESKMQVSENVWSLMSLAAEPWRNMVARITCPTLLLTADSDKGAIVTPEVAQEAVSLMADGHWARIEGAGHNIRREQFEPYMAAVKTFLAEPRG